jgi:ribosomal-protein-alanine N-acetyltransferase
MLTFNFDPFPFLTTERLILRQAKMDDVEEVFFLRSDPRVLKYIDRAPCQSIDEAASFIRMITDMVATNNGISWTIALKDDDKKIGDIALWRLIKEHHWAEIGYTLHPDYQGKGIMSEAMTAVLDHAFNVMNLHSIEANTNPENKASQQLLLKHGFVQEAYFRENYYYDGKFLDSAIYSLLTPLR